ncbi:MAG: UDP-N-acetylmuramoyl-L-alanyl-D-glutamate--2,6-diaminopimelate ligase [Acidimicrobiales bacterium]|nr:UDP-N-acetylmuramoyl-L-alanyl-D-glutamate--2,6-diaminopimelate ligase [Acidimicrobiales bacterium]
MAGRTSMLLRELLAQLPDAMLVGGDPATAGMVEVTSVAFDSRRVEPGQLFCCVRGTRTDGHCYAADAIRAGAVALLCEQPLDGSVPQLVVPDSRLAMALAADAVFGHPSGSLTVIGVTGTNGKTTTTYLLKSVLAAAGREVEVLGTLSGARTTPEAPDLQRWLAERRDAGVDAVAMEVSSHALALHRVDGTRFAVAVFTNLSRDHLDFHGTMEDYFRAKARLFDPDLCDQAVVNLESPHGRLLFDTAKVPTTGYSMEQAEELVVEAGGSRFRWHGHTVHLQLGGRFNVSNALAAATTGLVLGLDPAAIAAGLSTPIAVPGRFELVDAGQPFKVIVDYAHTPDGLEQLLVAARELAGDGAVTVVFGCGGERDQTKRAPMGEVAARLADRVVLTADNSRGEQTEAIIDAVREGFEHAPERQARELVIEPDRDAAIGVALRSAAPGDLVLIAGKGHETTQTIGEVTVAFDDREVARRHLEAMQ